RVASVLQSACAIALRHEPLLVEAEALHEEAAHRFGARLRELQIELCAALGIGMPGDEKRSPRQPRIGEGTPHGAESVAAAVLRLCSGPAGTAAPTAACLVRR